MKCKICGHSTRTLKAMGEHYRKRHPNAMKRKSAKSQHRGLKTLGKMRGVSYCPTCGKPL